MDRQARKNQNLPEMKLDRRICWKAEGTCFQAALWAKWGKWSV